MGKTPFEQARAKMLAIGEQARNNPEYMAQLKASPVATLEAAGLSEGYVVDLMEEEGITPEVGGYMMKPDEGCTCTGCCCTNGCCISF